MSHTPGPWFHDKQESSRDPAAIGIYDHDWTAQTNANGVNFVAKALFLGQDAYESQLANAKLIASAPELLEAITGLFEHCAMIHKHWGDGDNRQQADAAIATARAAIAKATE